MNGPIACNMLEYEEKLWAEGCRLVVGVDEAGRGPLAGPVVAAAVGFPVNQKETYGIRDSKRLCAAQREELFTVIQRRALAVGVGIADVEEIDRYNILQAALMAMRRAVEAVLLPIDFILVDGNRLPDLAQPAQAVVRGDARSLSIAAASIIAKVTRDRIMMQWHEQFPQYDFARNKGYPTERHIEAIRRYGLSPIHRRSFHPKALCK